EIPPEAPSCPRRDNGFIEGSGQGRLRCMDRHDHFECRARITNQIFRAMNRATWLRTAAPYPDRWYAPSHTATPMIAKNTPAYIQYPERIITGTKTNRTGVAYCRTSEASP